MRNLYSLMLSGFLLLVAGQATAQRISVALTDADGPVGTEICMDLIGRNFTAITGMQFTILYDAAVLENTSAMGDINGNTVSMVQPAARPGEIRVSYSPFSTTGYTDAGPFTFGTICFRVLQDSETTVVIGDNPVPLEFTNEDETTFGVDEVDVTNGTVNGGNGGGSTATCSDGMQNGSETGVDCGGPDCAPCQTMPTCSDGVQNGSETGVDCGGPDCAPCSTGGGTCGEGSDRFNICTETVCDVASGARVCLDLTVRNFVNITSVQCTLNYPGANLEYSNFTGNAALGSGLLVNSPNDGEVRIVFFRSANSPQTLNDDDVMATLCFNTETAAATNVTINGLRVANTMGEVPGPVGNPGGVNICGQTASCTDGIQNGGETGVDCGGPDCAPCQTTSTCTDGVQNGSETGVDCGGPDCAPCQTSGGSCGEGTTNFTICAEEICDVAVGDRACIDLTVGNFVDITSVQCTLNYPGANLQYSNFTGNAALGSGLLVNSPNDGEVRLVFFRSANSPQTLADDAVMATLCFTVESAAGSVIEVNNLRASDTDGPLVMPVGNDGRINGCMSNSTCSDGIQNGSETGVDCGGPDCVPCAVTNCGGATDDVEICLGSACAAAGTEVCIPVFVGNFDNLAGIQFTLSHPAANLNYSRFTAQDQFSLGTQVSVPNDANGNPIDGQVRFVWNDPDVSGESFPADQAAFEICFDVENTLTSPLTFTEPTNQTLRAFNQSLSSTPIVGNPGAINQNCPAMPTCDDGVQNGQETGVDCGGPDCPACPQPTCDDGIQNGSETGVDCGGPDCPACPTVTCDAGTDEVSICIGDACNIPVGGQACVDLTVSNFTSVTGLELRLNYPGANLDFVSFTGNTTLNDPIQANDFSDGELRLLFFDQNRSGESLADGEVLGTVCFTVQDASAANLMFSRVRIGTLSGNVAVPGSTTGTVNGCVTAPTCDDGVRNGQETGIDCGGPDCAPCATMSSLDVIVGEATGTTGDQACVNVTVNDFTDITNLTFTLNYDPAVLQLATLTANSSLPGFGPGNFDSSTAGQITVTYTSATPRTLANGAAFFNVCFNVLTNDGSDLTVSNASASNGSAVTVNTTNGRINGQLSFDNLTLVVNNGAAAVGQQVCVDIDLYEGIDLAGLQFAIDYDADNLEFVSATGTDQLRNIQAANPSEGLLRIIWFDPNVQPNTVPNGESIIQLCFNVLRNCETSLVISEQPPQFRIRATTNTNESLQVDRQNGTINAGQTDCGGGGGGSTPDNLVLALGSASGTVGEEVCVDLRATNFTNLTQLSFSVTHDAANARFQRAINFGLGSITTANVGSPAAGTVAFTWNAPGSDGETLPDNGTLVTLCYRVDRVAVTPLSFGNTPNAIAARNADNQNVGIVPSGGSINPDAPQTDGLTFQIGSATGEVGDNVCLPVIGFDVENLVSFQYTINYDPTILRYTGTGNNFALPGLSAASISENPAGSLRVVWFDPSANPNTLPSGTALFSICFEILQTDLTLVTFGSSPTAIEFEDTDGVVTADLLNGQINGSAAPVIANSSITPPRCRDGNDGSIVLSVNGSNNLSYRWSPNATTTGPTATGLRPGTYSVTVTNQTTGQFTSDSFTVPNPGAFAVAVGSVNGVSCNGDSDGSIVVVPSGTTGPYLYDWSGNLQDGQPTQTGLNGGSYSVTVTDDNGCRMTLPNIMIGEPAEIEIIGSSSGIAPGGTGGITVEVEGGRTPYSYAWSGPGNFTSTSEDISGLTMTGTYCLTVTDNANCTEQQCFAVAGQLAIIGTSINVGCAGQDDASIDLTVSGGSGNYDYAWSNGANTEDISGLSPGDYTVTVTSGNNMITQTVTVDPATPILLNAVVTPSTNGSNGSITLAPTGGNSPYTFRWDDGVTTQNRSNLAAGQLCVTVTDVNNCTEDACFTVGAMAGSIASVSTTPATCADEADGTVRVVLSNATAPITIRIEPTGATETSATTDVTLTLAGGEYDLFLTDAQGTSFDTTVTVGSPAALEAVATPTSDTEDTDCTGMITLAVTGGTPPYSASWSDGGTGVSRSLLCAGSYAATVTDANNCTLTVAAVDVNRIDEVLDSIVPVACTDGTEGAINVTISGGTEPYVFAWNRVGDATVLATTEDLSGQGTGDYRLVITDATGAMLVRTYSIGLSSGFSASASVTTDFGGFGVSCTDASDGRIVITLSGQGEFMYEFTRDGAMIGTDSILENASAGAYVATVIDDGGCEINIDVTVTAPPAIAINGTANRASCAGEDDGFITVAPAGGVGTFDVLWSTGATTPRISGLSPDDYSVTVTDDNGCTASETFTVTGPEDLVFTFESTPATEGCNGSILIIPLGGSGNYTYVWPQLPGQGDNPLAEGLCPGVYTVEVSDANDCQTVVMEVEVTDRRFPCLSVRDVITPNGDGLNEAFVITCSDGDEALNNSLQIFNRYGQRVFSADNYQCSDSMRGDNCFEGRTNDGAPLPDGPYFYVFEFTNLLGEPMQQRGSLTIVRD